MRTTAGPKGEPCLERAVAGNYSGVDASRCSCPISAGGIVWCRVGNTALDAPGTEISIHGSPASPTGLPGLLFASKRN